MGARAAAAKGYSASCGKLVRVIRALGRKRTAAAAGGWRSPPAKPPQQPVSLARLGRFLFNQEV